ncbi:inorganic diphosphatase, partial [Pseudomonas aeruginosa]|uniref:inorganic diphosphatase n=1 Tax=Pseudomonas aeruginosa TaxID=287 RepID=UPI0031B6EBE2
DIYVVIEIPANADPIKYEIDKESGALFVDRFMSTAMFYPCNYGYINHTLSLDGDPVDVLVPTPYPLEKYKKDGTMPEKLTLTKSTLYLPDTAKEELEKKKN